MCTAASGGAVPCWADRVDGGLEIDCVSNAGDDRAAPNLCSCPAAPPALDDDDEAHGNELYTLSDPVANHTEQFRTDTYNRLASNEDQCPPPREFLPQRYCTLPLGVATLASGPDGPGGHIECDTDADCRVKVGPGARCPPRRGCADAVPCGGAARGACVFGLAAIDNVGSHWAPHTVNMTCGGTAAGKFNVVADSLQDAIEMCGSSCRRSGACNGMFAVAGTGSDRQCTLCRGVAELAEPTVFPSDVYSVPSGEIAAMCNCVKNNTNQVGWHGLACTCPIARRPADGFSNYGVGITHAPCSGHGRCCPHGEASHEAELRYKHLPQCAGADTGCVCLDDWTGPACTCRVGNDETLPCGGDAGRAHPNAGLFMDIVGDTRDADARLLASGCGYSECLCAPDWSGKACATRVSSVVVEPEGTVEGGFDAQLERRQCGAHMGRGGVADGDPGDPLADEGKDDGTCKCAAFDDVNAREGGSAIRRRFNGTACQCLEMRKGEDWYMCGSKMGHGDVHTCVEPSMPWGTCEGRPDEFTAFPTVIEEWDEAHYVAVLDYLHPPTLAPTDSPSASPSVSPSASPSASPSVSPSVSPSASPSASPTGSTKSPTAATSPTDGPTRSPSASPSGSPSTSPTASPSMSPSTSPSVSPTNAPTKSPTEATSCTRAQNLCELTSPHADERNDHDLDNLSTCGGGWSKEKVFFIDLPPGKKITIYLAEGAFTNWELRWGGSCPGTTIVSSCRSDPGWPYRIWRNEGDSTERAYFIVDGDGTDSGITGTFTINWSTSAGSCPPTVAPTESPSASPSVSPSASPSVSPSTSPSSSPSRSPSVSPTNKEPTAPTEPTSPPTASRRELGEKRQLYGALTPPDCPDGWVPVFGSTIGECDSADEIGPAYVDNITHCATVCASVAACVVFDFHTQYNMPYYYATFTLKHKCYGQPSCPTGQELGDTEYTACVQADLADKCVANVDELGYGGGTVSGSTVRQPRLLNEGCAPGGQGGPEKIYRVDVPTSDILRVTVWGYNFPVTVYLYYGGLTCPGTNFVAAPNFFGTWVDKCQHRDYPVDDTSMNFYWYNDPLWSTPGTSRRVWVVVDSVGDSDGGSFTMNWSVEPMPTPSPTAYPTPSPTVSPSTSPSASPSASPSVSPSASPSASPSSPTTSPSTSPSVSPSPPTHHPSSFDVYIAASGAKTSYDLKNATVRAEVFATFRRKLQPVRCAANWQCATYLMGSRCLYPPVSTPPHKPWRNAVVNSLVDASSATEDDARRVGDEGGCQCNHTGWAAELFCEDCNYGSGPRSHEDFKLTECDRSLLKNASIAVGPCTAPYALDPVLSSPATGYKLCAGHGIYDGEACTCFDDYENGTLGHWTLAVPDGSVRGWPACVACGGGGVWGPKPYTTASAETREAWNDEEYRYNGTCALDYVQACNVLGQFDPVVAYNRTLRDVTWRACAGHGTWDATARACKCHHGWALGPIDPLYDTMGLGLKTCNMCEAGFGPPVPTQPLMTWWEEHEGWSMQADTGDDDDDDIDEDHVFCAGPWARDPMAPNTSKPLLCAGHGEVVVEALEAGVGADAIMSLAAAEAAGNKTCMCDASGGAKGYWTGFACEECAAGWDDNHTIGCRRPVGPDPVLGAAGGDVLPCSGHGTAREVVTGGEYECDCYGSGDKGYWTGVACGQCISSVEEALYPDGPLLGCGARDFDRL